MPYELNTRYCVTAVELYVQSERILMSHVKPCSLRRISLLSTRYIYLNDTSALNPVIKAIQRQVLCLCMAEKTAGIFAEHLQTNDW
jgi:hypothetical protein